MLVFYRFFFLCLKMVILILNMICLNFVEFVFWILIRIINDGIEELLVVFYYYLYFVFVNYICGKILCIFSCVGFYKML